MTEKSVVTYLWSGSRDFQPSYVNTLARMIKHHLPEPHRFICVSDVTSGFSPEVEVLPMPAAARALGSIETPERDGFPSSYRRLWTLSEEAARLLGEWVLLLDVDCVIVNDMRPLFRLKADFVGWSVRPPRGGPKRFGGGTWLHRTGTRTSVYERFVADPDRCIATARAAGYRGSDQAWISYCLAKTEPCWPEPSGIVCAQDFLASTVLEPIPRPKLPAALSRYRIPVRYRRVHRALAIPPGAICLHYNGGGTRKPWNTDDVITREHWKPFFK